MSDETARVDVFMVIAISIIAYAIANISHEIIGHCSTALVFGTKCKVVSSTYIPLAREVATWKYNVIVIGGCTGNFIVALICLVALRRWPGAKPATRYLLWLTMAVNLFLASTYITAAPIIEYGDSYILIRDLSHQLFWMTAVILTGLILVCLSFWICRKEFSKLIGVDGREGRSLGLRLVVPAYLAGGILTVSSALFSQLEAKLAQLQAAGGTFGLTIWLLILPFILPRSRTPSNRFHLPRSLEWIMAGALTALIFIGVLGPGINV